VHRKEPETLDPFPVSPNTGSSKSMLPQAYWLEEGSVSSRLFYVVGSNLPLYSDFPTPGYTNNLNYFKLIISKIVFKQKIV
jgi:hypothetical protein